MLSCHVVSKSLLGATYSHSYLALGSKKQNEKLTPACKYTCGHLEWWSSVESEMSSALLALILSVTQVHTCATRDCECTGHWTCVTSELERTLCCSQGLILICALAEVRVDPESPVSFQADTCACQHASEPACNVQMRKIFTKQTLVCTEYKWNITEH